MKKQNPSQPKGFTTPSSPSPATKTTEEAQEIDVLFQENFSNLTEYEDKTAYSRITTDPEPKTDEGEKFWMLLPLHPERDFGMSELERMAVDAVFENQQSHTVSAIPEGVTVIPRFGSIAPQGETLELEVQSRGSRLLNTFSQHAGIANLFNWVDLLEEYTAKTYHIEDIPNLPEVGEWFVKGSTNSIKNRWFDCCYANNKQRLIEVVRNNQLDGWVGSQQIAIREFENFQKIAEAVDGRPIFNEWRMFVLDGKVISEGFYWSSFVDDIPDEIQQGTHPERRQTLAESVIDRVGHLGRFFVIDVAETPDGDWRVVELNDACMSGLSENDPIEVWKAFSKTA